MSLTVVALGSNVGDGFPILVAAVQRLAKAGKIQAVSSVYRTAPMYVTDQPDFLNAALTLETDLGPLPLLKTLKAIEQALGRQAGPRFGPRELDLDLISYGALQYQFFEGKELKLQVPHPRVVERRFVLAPLAEIAPELVLPGLGRVSELLGQTQSQSEDVQKTDLPLADSIPR